jgi:hypothetical protein
LLVSLVVSGELSEQDVVEGDRLSAGLAVVGPALEERLQ